MAKTIKNLRETAPTKKGEITLNAMLDYVLEESKEDRAWFKKLCKDNTAEGDKIPKGKNETIVRNAFCERYFPKIANKSKSVAGKIDSL